MSRLRKYYLLLFASCSCLSVTAQDYPGGVKVSGSLQSDMLIPQNDAEIGAEKTEDFQTNTFAEFMLLSKSVDAGVRLEYLEHPLPGFEHDFEGWGLPHFWVKGGLDCA